LYGVPNGAKPLRLRSAKQRKKPNNHDTTATRWLNGLNTDVVARTLGRTGQFGQNIPAVGPPLATRSNDGVRVGRWALWRLARGLTSTRTYDMTAQDTETSPLIGAADAVACVSRLRCEPDVGFFTSTEDVLPAEAQMGARVDVRPQDSLNCCEWPNFLRFPQYE
jgi:hypothetical protein